MLVDRLERYDVPVWLVNTGWTGGPYGTGERMNIDHTRNMVRAALNGELAGRRRPSSTRSSGSRSRPQVPGVPTEVLRAARRPGRTRPPTTRRPASSRTMFHENFEAYADGVSDGGPRRRARSRSTRTTATSPSPRPGEG